MLLVWMPASASECRKVVLNKSMNNPNQEFVYHGSQDFFETVIPKRQIRTVPKPKKNQNEDENKDQNQEIIFDEISFHATAYKWIALAYTYNRKSFEINGKVFRYNMGVNLYDYTEEIEIHGFNSLEESLHQMYGDGGYIFIFKKEDFFYTKGLGNLEVITKDNIKPVSVERIDDPVAELKKLDIKFNFVDLAKPENAGYYKTI